MENTNTNNDVETTTPVVTETIQTNITTEGENSASQSGEDLNTQAEDSKSNSQDVSGDGKESNQSRFDSLQAERSTKTKWEQDREQTQMVEQQMSALTPTQQLQQFGYTALELKVARMEEERGWEKAYSKHHELQKDPKLDNLVYSNYVARKNAGESVDPTKVADEILGYLETRTKEVKSKTYEQAENDIAQKASLSQKSSQRSANRGGEVDLKDLRHSARFGKGSERDDAIDRLLDLI